MTFSDPLAERRSMKRALEYGRAPLEFGARNWVRLIDFEGEQVSALCEFEHKIASMIILPKHLRTNSSRGRSDAALDGGNGRGVSTHVWSIEDASD